MLQAAKGKGKKKAVAVDSDDDDAMSMTDNSDDSDFEAAPKKVVGLRNPADTSPSRLAKWAANEVTKHACL